MTDSLKTKSWIIRLSSEYFVGQSRGSIPGEGSRHGIITFCVSYAFVWVWRPGTVTGAPRERNPMFDNAGYEYLTLGGLQFLLRV